MRITVGIEARLLESADDGRTWIERTRVVPPPTNPTVRGGRDGMRLPALAGWRMTDVHIGPDGVGLGAGREPVRGDNRRDWIARFWLTWDGGATWQPVHP